MIIDFSLSSPSPASPWCHYWFTKLCKIRNYWSCPRVCVTSFKGSVLCYFAEVSGHSHALVFDTLLFDALWVWHLLLILWPGTLMSSGAIQDVVWFIFPIVFILQWFPGEGAVSAPLHHFKTRSVLQFFEILIFWLLLTPFNPCWI